MAMSPPPGEGTRRFLLAHNELIAGSPFGNAIRYLAYMAILAFSKVAPGGGSFRIASS